MCLICCWLPTLQKGAAYLGQAGAYAAAKAAGLLVAAVLAASSAVVPAAHTPPRPVLSAATTVEHARTSSRSVGTELTHSRCLSCRAGIGAVRLTSTDPTRGAQLLERSKERLHRRISQLPPPLHVPANLPAKE